MKVYYLQDNLFEVVTHKGTSFKGDYEAVRRFCMGLGMLPDEFTMGMFDLDGIEANVSDFGYNLIWMYSKFVSQNEVA